MINFNFSVAVFLQMCTYLSSTQNHKISVWTRVDIKKILPFLSKQDTIGNRAKWPLFIKLSEESETRPEGKAFSYSSLYFITKRPMFCSCLIIILLWTIPGFYLIHFWSFQTGYTFLQQINLKNIFLAYNARIWTHDLLIMSLI